MTIYPLLKQMKKIILPGIYVNLDSAKVARDTVICAKWLQKFGDINAPVMVEITGDPLTYNKYYYGDHALAE